MILAERIDVALMAIRRAAAVGASRRNERAAVRETVALLRAGRAALEAQAIRQYRVTARIVSDLPWGPSALAGPGVFTGD